MSGGPKMPPGKAAAAMSALGRSGACRAAVDFDALARALGHVSFGGMLARYGMQSAMGAETQVQAADRLAAGRQALQVSVTRATPLLQALEPGELAAVLEALTGPPRPVGRPVATRDWARTWRSPSYMLRRPGKGGLPPDVFGPGPSLARLIRRGGAMARGLDDVRGAIGIRPVDGSIEMAALRGDTIVMTCGGRVKVELPFEIPRIWEASAVGRRLGDVVDEPMFSGRDYTIVAIRVEDGTSSITAKADDVEFEMPWIDAA